MRRRLGMIAMTVASGTCVVGGAAWLVVLARSDDAASVTRRLESGETLTIEYDAPDSHEFTPAEREAARRVTG